MTNLTDPDYMVRSLEGLLKLSPAVEVSSRSRQDAVKIIATQGTER